MRGDRECETGHPTTPASKLAPTSRFLSLHEQIQHGSSGLFDRASGYINRGPRPLFEQLPCCCNLRPHAVQVDVICVSHFPECVEAVTPNLDEPIRRRPKTDYEWPLGTQQFGRQWNTGHYGNVGRTNTTNGEID